MISKMHVNEYYSAQEHRVCVNNDKNKTIHMLVNNQQSHVLQKHEC